VEAERRQVTVLFTDMVGFTSYSERSGEEAAFTLMRSLSKLMDQAVREQGGVVRGFTGDGIMAVFGAPIAFEDAPLRACRAALNILQRLKAAEHDLKAKHGLSPQLRIGLNAGTAVVGKVEDSADAGVTVLGDTVNFAARLQSLAEPNAVFISTTVHRLVQGLVDANFAGEYTIKGKSERQRVFRLEAIHQGATRFDAAVSRGLSTFVGRQHELELLERSLDKARSQLCVIDLVAEPGMGKSRLLHEFRQRIGNNRAFILSGSCSSDGQHTPFLPFIEVIRGSFRISAGEAENEIAKKLEIGLTTLSLHSDRNLGLLLHLLGLNVPNDALAGLDGVLIGLRTRELLQQLLEARCRLSPVVMLIEDLHWIDSASGELLAKIVDSKGKLQLLLLHTRRPEHVPSWLDRAPITELPLGPLSAGDIRHLVQARLAVEALPEVLARQLSEKAEGNPLFAEEMVSFLTERSIIRTASGRLDFDSDAVAAALPPSVNSVLTARVDRLAPNDRTLLQAASVIGRRFNPQLLAVVVGENDVDTRLADIQTLDLVRPEARSGDYQFKHALVRDALYQSLLTEARTALHLKIAEVVERRSGNRLTEVAEVLAHHYSQTDLADKAFAYLSMAGSKNLSVYSLDEGSTHFAAAVALLDKYPDCASDHQVAACLEPYAQLLSMSGKITMVITVVERYWARISRLGVDPRIVIIGQLRVNAFVFNLRYQEAIAAQKETSRVANYLNDARSKAYALSAEILVSPLVAPKPLRDWEILKQKAIEAASDAGDGFIQNHIMWWIGANESHRGRFIQARRSARELMELGRQRNDPRATGFGLVLLGLIAIASDSYAETLEYGEQASAVAVAPLDRNAAICGKGIALVLMRRLEEGLLLLKQQSDRLNADGALYSLNVTDPVVGVAKVLNGNVAEGINWIEQAILRREREGARHFADWYRLILGEIYLQALIGREKLPLPVLVKNLPILLMIRLTASSRIQRMMTHVLENPHFDPDGFRIGHAHVILGLLYKVKNKRPVALKHLTEAKRILVQFGPSQKLTRVETALAELGQ
jgi:class 3 adenylate cyclase